MPKPWKKELIRKQKEEISETGESTVSNVSPDKIDIDLLTIEIGSVPEIDLHGLSSEEAGDILVRFLEDRAMAGDKGVRIIYGKGEGVLRKMVLPMLKKMENDGILVSAYKESDQPHEAGAVAVVLLR